jgi:hypothetical protein
LPVSARNLKKIIIARIVLSKWKIVSTSFFEPTNFEQLIMTQLY